MSRLEADALQEKLLNMTYEQASKYLEKTFGKKALKGFNKGVEYGKSERAKYEKAREELHSDQFEHR